MHLFLKDIVSFEDFDKEDYDAIQKQRKNFLQNLDQNSGPFHILYSDFYLGEKLRFSMGVSEPLLESEVVVCIDRNISYLSFPFSDLDDLDRLWLKILSEENDPISRAYLIDYEVHHGDGSGELYLSIQDF